MTLRHVLSAVCAAALLAGCGGGIQTAAPLPPPSDARDANPNLPPSTGALARLAREQRKRPGHLTVRIRIPKKHRHRGGRGSHYVSAATQGMTATFSGPSTFTQAIDLTPSDPRCTGSPLVCTIGFSLLPGRYKVTVKTYDLPPVSGAIPASAKLLSTVHNAPLTIAGGVTNAFSITLDGVPAALFVTGLPIATPGTAFASPKPFTVVAKDAGGYVIAGTYSTPIALTDSDTSGATSIATAGADNPPAGELLGSSDTATIAYNGATIGVVTITASAPGAASGTGSFGPIPPLLVAAASDGVVYGIPTGCASVTCAVVQVSGLVRPYGLAVDSSGNLYVGDVGNGTVLKVPVGCQSTSCGASLGGGSSSFDYPSGVAVDGAGTVYVGNELDSAVSVVPAGCVTATCVTGLGGGFIGPAGLSVDGSGNVFVADFSLNRVDEIPAGCTSSSCVTPIGGGFSSPYGTAVDSSGNVYVAGNSSETVDKIPPGCLSSACVSNVGGGFIEPAGVAVDSNANVFVTDFATGDVSEVPAGCASASCTILVASGFGEPLGIAVP